MKTLPPCVLIALRTDCRAAASAADTAHLTADPRQPFRVALVVTNDRLPIRAKQCWQTTLDLPAPIGGDKGPLTQRKRYRKAVTKPPFDSSTPISPTRSLHHHHHLLRRGI